MGNQVVAAAPTSHTTMSPGARELVLAADRGILAISWHWLLIANTIAGLFAALPLLGPWLLAHGYTVPARGIYAIYSLFRHQMPSRSFFVCGQKMCYCERCTAIYTGGFIFGLAYALVSRRTKPLRWRWMFALWASMAIDGFSQLAGLRESNWQPRIVTGTLFALSCVWVAYPYLRDGFEDMREALGRRLRPAPAPAPNWA